MRCRLTLLMCALALLGVLAAPAAATHVSCGEVITQDTTLDSDLVDCPGDGVVIGAGDITLDLAGHTIDGTGTDAGNQGVDNNASDNVTVMNGHIRQFQAAVSIRAAGANEIRGLSLAESGIAVFAQDSSATLIEGNVIRSSRAGVLLLREGNFNEVRGNSVSGSQTAISVAGFGSEPLNHTLVADNRVFENVTGVLFATARNTLATGNHVTRNAEEGLIVTAGSDSSRIEGNVANDNGTVGILVSGSSRVQITSNRTWDNGGDGVEVRDPTVTDISIVGNFSKGNGDDGIDVDTPSATLADNKAIRNGDFGIEAVPGVTDGGGNKAHANGNPAQCLNVACR